MIFVRVERCAGPDELLPPTWLGVGRCGVSVGRGGEAGVKKYGIAAAGIEVTPGLIGEGVGGQGAAPVEEKRIWRVEGLMCTGRV